MTAELMCLCGKPIHYTDKELEAMMNDLVQELGPYIPVTVDGKTWQVPRHFIALHGIKGKDIATLGFSEVKDGK